MAATASHPTTSTEAPWKSLFVSHLSKFESSPEFTLATVSAVSPSSTPIPRLRTCIHRGFWASPLPENKHNDHEPNPHIYDSDCPTFSTDCRMSKTYDIFATGKGHGSLEQSRSGTGGGGYVEACYWVKDVMTQWRVLGKCWIIAANDVDAKDQERDVQNSGTVTVKAELGRYMRPASDSKSNDAGNWSWKREVDMHFANLSPGMRGSFKNPPPGIPRKDQNGKSTAGEGESLGQKAGNLEDEPLARQNFRVAVIAPEEVEMVDLTDPENSTRRRWTLKKEVGGTGAEAGPGAGGAGAQQQTEANKEPVGEWEEVELWP